MRSVVIYEEGNYIAQLLLQLHKLQLQ